MGREREREGWEKREGGLGREKQGLGEREKERELQLLINGSLIHAAENPWKVEATSADDRWQFPSTEAEQLRFRVFEDLWQRKYYLTAGGKFGGDFLVYPGILRSPGCYCLKKEGRIGFYLTMHSTHFNYGYMASGIW